MVHLSFELPYCAGRAQESKSSQQPRLKATEAAGRANGRVPVATQGTQPGPEEWIKCAVSRGRAPKVHWPRKAARATLPGEASG
jgi:hypothetical protein